MEATLQKKVKLQDLKRTLKRIKEKMHEKYEIDDEENIRKSGVVVDFISRYKISNIELNEGGLNPHKIPDILYLYLFHFTPQQQQAFLNDLGVTEEAL